MAKSKNGQYESDKRIMCKIAHERACDCVIAGFRWYRKGERPAIGSLLLGLYDDAGVYSTSMCAAVFSQSPLRTRQLLEALS
jgi:ATP-dependent DNA ligase